jgi:hypothetical protein
MSGSVSSSVMLQRANKHDAKKVKALMAAKLKGVLEIMRDFPVLVDRVYEFAEKEKLTMQETHGVTLCPARPTLATPSSKTDAQKMVDGVVDMNWEAYRLREIDRQSHQIKLLPVMDLKFLLFTINERDYTPYSIKALLVRGQRDVTKGRLCEVLYHLTGLAPEFKITLDRFPTIGRLGEYLEHLHTEKGQRSFVMKMPPDFAARDACFKIVGVEEGKVVVKHKYTDKPYVVERTYFRFQDATAVRLTDTHADEATLLVEDGNPETRLLWPLVCASSQMLALCDGRLALGDSHHGQQPAPVDPAGLLGYPMQGFLECRPGRANGAKRLRIEFKEGSRSVDSIDQASASSRSVAASGDPNSAAPLPREVVLPAVASAAVMPTHAVPKNEDSDDADNEDDKNTGDTKDPDVGKENTGDAAAAVGEVVGPTQEPLVTEPLVTEPLPADNLSSDVGFKPPKARTTV